MCRICRRCLGFVYPYVSSLENKNPSIKLGIPAHQAQGQALVAFASPAIQFNILVTFFNIFNPSKMRHFQTIFRCNGYYSYILILNTYFHVT